MGFSESQPFLRYVGECENRLGVNMEDLTMWVAMEACMLLAT